MSRRSQTLGSVAFYVELGKCLKVARESSGKRVSEIAKTLNLTPSAMVNIEAGRQRVDVWTLIQISGLLGERPDRLMICAILGVQAATGKAPIPLEDVKETI